MNFVVIINNVPIGIILNIANSIIGFSSFKRSLLATLESHFDVDESSIIAKSNFSLESFYVDFKPSIDVLFNIDLAYDEIVSIHQVESY